MRREDEYRDATRLAIANLLTAAIMYARAGWTLSDPLLVIGLGYQGALKLHAATDEAMRSTTQAQITARLLVLDALLASRLDEFAESLDETASVVHEAMDSLSQGRAPTAVWGERDERFARFHDVCRALQADASVVLAPTVRTVHRGGRCRADPVVPSSAPASVSARPHV